MPHGGMIWALALLGPGPLGPWPTWALARLGPGPLGPWHTWARAHLGPGPLGPWPTWALAHLGPGPLGPGPLGQDDGQDDEVCIPRMIDRMMGKCYIFCNFEHFILVYRMKCLSTRMIHPDLGQSS